MTSGALRGAVCDEDGCFLAAYTVWLPDAGAGRVGPYHYCARHLYLNGFCPCCLQFYGAVDSFWTSETGFCATCEREMIGQGLTPQDYRAARRSASC